MNLQSQSMLRSTAALFCRLQRSRAYSSVGRRETRQALTFPCSLAVAQDKISFTLPSAKAAAAQHVGLANRPFTSAVISFGGTLASAACAAGASLVYDGEGRRRTLLGGSPASGRAAAAAPTKEALPAEPAATAEEDVAGDPRRISDIWDENGKR